MTSLYNHNTLGTKEKPLITNYQFKKLMERIRNGETGLYEKAINHFSFEATQLRMLKTETLNKNGTTTIKTD